MSQQGSRLREVQADPAPQTDAQQPNVGMQLLLLALKTLSQRFVVALAGLRGLMLAGTVFWATLQVLADPNTPRLVGLGLYGGFVLILEFMVNRKR